jgi:aspartate racemase
VIPDPVGRAEVHRVIFDELCKGDCNADSRQRLNHIIRRQIGAGAEGVVLACTELSLTLSQADVGVPLFDTTALHALAAVAFALGADKATTQAPLMLRATRHALGLQNLCLG